MADLEAVNTANAPAALGPYSQAIKAGELVFLSGQIPLIPASMEVVAGGIEAQALQVFDNLAEVANAAGSSLDRAVKLTIYLIDLGDFAKVNEIMASKFTEPYPARATIQVSALPKGVSIEIDAILTL